METETKTEKKSWINKVDLRNRAGVAHAAGIQYGAEAFLRHVDKYRIFMGPFFLLLAIGFLLFGQYLYALVSFGFMHLSVILNQLWWKLMMIEKKIEGER